MFVTPTAFFRSGDRVVLFLDTEIGWTYLRMIQSLATAESRTDFLTDFVDSVPDEVLGLPGEGLAVVLLEATPLPLSTPDHALVGVHPALRDPSIPFWEGPTTRDEEVRAEATLVDEVEAYLASVS